MTQMDPLEDYPTALVALEEYEWLQGHLQDPVPLPGTAIDLVKDSAFIDCLANLTVSPQKGRYMFFHHYGETLDFSRITDEFLPTDANDIGMRMWGEPSWVVANTGRDVERMLWEDAMSFWCRLEGYGK